MGYVNTGELYAADTTSNAKKLREVARELMGKGLTVSPQDILSRAREVYGIEFSEGMLAGAMRTLIEQEGDKYEVVSRGQYRLKPQEAKDETKTLNNCFDELLRQLDIYVRMVDITKMNTQEVTTFHADYTNIALKILNLRNETMKWIREGTKRKG